MPFALLDVIVIVVVLISAVLAMVRGFVREVLSVASWIVAVAAAYYLYGSLLPLVRPYFDSLTVATIVASAAIFFVALIVASFVTMKVADVVIDSRVGALDRALGFIFGAGRGVLIAVIALWFFTFLVDQNRQPGWVANAQTRPILKSLGDRLVAALPDDIEAVLLKRFRGTRDEAGSDATPPAEEADEPAPSDAARKNLDRLIQNNGRPGTGN